VKDDCKYIKHSKWSSATGTATRQTTRKYKVTDCNTSKEVYTNKHVSVEMNRSNTRQRA